MKRYTLAIGKIQIKAIMRQYYTPTEMPKIKKDWSCQTGKDREHLHLSYIAGGIVKCCNPFGK